MVDNQFSRALGVLTPSSYLAVVTPGVATSSNAVALNQGGSSGYRSEYQNTQDEAPGWNGDQGHHFAAFFQLGYAYARNTMFPIAAASMYEYVQGAASGLNYGDVSLGVAAVRIGAAVACGHLALADVGSVIPSTLCK